MSQYQLDNPVFYHFAIAAALMVLKIMGQGWMSVYRLMRSNSGLASPEDLRPGMLNPKPSADQLDVNDYVDRSRRIHRNDLENIPAFWVAGLIFVAVQPSVTLAVLLFYGFVLSRIGHFFAYATKQSHEVRSVFYTVGSLIVMYMAAHVLWVLMTM